jgi:hypothetical protein
MVYGQYVVSEGTVRQWCRMFKGGPDLVPIEYLLEEMTGNVYDTVIFREIICRLG